MGLTGDRPRPSDAVAVRPAAPDEGEPVAALLYASAGAKYDQFAGSRRAALVLLARAFARSGNTASAEVVSVAEIDGAVAGAIAAFPSVEGDDRTRRFLRVGLRAVAPWRWPRMLEIHRLGADVTPLPPPRSLYVDALASDVAFRRRGVGRALLAEAQRRARAEGMPALALDTGSANLAARALYEDFGFELSRRHQPDGWIDAVLAYVKRLD